MERPPRPLDDALATLRTRWGSAAVRLGGMSAPGPSAGPGPSTTPGSTTPGSGTAETAIHGSLALSVPPEPDAAPRVEPGRPEPGVISTGFPALDAILGPSGLPREASVVIRGGPSSGKTTLALRCVAEAQADGDVVAWLDLTRALDPVEAVARGVDLRWLLVVRPADTAEGFALAGALLSGRSVGLLVVDLPARARARADEQLRRLVAHTRRVAARLILLEPLSLDRATQAALAGGTSLRLELERRAWLRLGRDVVGQRTAVAVAKNRYGSPGRSVDLDIHYLAEGQRSMATHRLASEEDGEPRADHVVRPSEPPGARPSRPRMVPPQGAAPAPGSGGASRPAGVPRPARAPRAGPRLVVV